MATNNKAISAYLPPDIEKCLTQYCTEYEITRKDKEGNIQPSLGTATVEILRIFFSEGNVRAPLPSNAPLLPDNVVTQDKLDETLSQLKALGNVPSTLPSNVVTEDRLNEAIANINVSSNLPDNVLTKKDIDEAIANINVSSNLPDNVLTKKDIDEAISASCHSVIADKIQNSECELSEYLDNKMNTAIAELKKQFENLHQNKEVVDALKK